MLCPVEQSVEWIDVEKPSSVTTLRHDRTDSSVRFRTYVTFNVADRMNEDFWIMLNDMLKSIKPPGSLINPGKYLFQHNFEAVIMTVIV